MKKAVELDPGMARSHLILGEILYRQKKFEDAEFELTQGLFLETRHHPSTRLLLANTYVKLNRLSDARDQYSAYVRENPYANNVDQIREQIRKIDSTLNMYKSADME